MKPNSKTYPVVPHLIKMFAKKTLRKLNSHSDGWRDLVEQAQKETDNEK